MIINIPNILHFPMNSFIFKISLITVNYDKNRRIKTYVTNIFIMIKIMKTTIIRLGKIRMVVLVNSE